MVTLLAPVEPSPGTVTASAPPADDRTPAEHPPGAQEPAADAPAVAVTATPLREFRAYCQRCDGVHPPHKECPGPAPAGPVPFLRGDFALYATPDNALVLAYRPDGTSEDRQLVVPAFILDMAARQSGQTTAQLISRLQEGI